MLRKILDQNSDYLTRVVVVVDEKCLRFYDDIRSIRFIDIVITSIPFINFDYFFGINRLVYHNIGFKAVDVLEILNENVYSNFFHNDHSKYINFIFSIKYIHSH